MNFFADSPSGAVAELSERGAIALAQGIVNDALNQLISSHSEHVLAYGDDRGQPIPFAGWYWRSVDFFGDGGVVIADSDDGIAVCENNKWGYEQRALTKDEQDVFLALAWNAYQESRRGGKLAEIQRDTREALKRAGEFIASLSVGVSV